MERVRMLSHARTELFALFEEVTTHAGRKIVLRHRGSARDAVLVGHDYLRRLEQARANMVAGRFSLFDSATLNRPLEEALVELREEDRVAFDRKLAAISDPETVVREPAAPKGGGARRGRKPRTGAKKR